MGILAAIGKFILPGVFEAVDKAVPDAGQAAQLKAQIQSVVISANAQELQEQAGVVVAEVQGGSWLQRNWRPATMMVFVFIIANNYIIAPYIGLFAPAYKLMLDTPQDL